MKTWLKILLGGLIGFGGGFASGFFVHKKLNDVKFEEVTEEEMERIEETIQKGKQGADEQDAVAKRFEGKDIPEDPDALRNTLQGKTTYEKASWAAQDSAKPGYESIKAYSGTENAGKMPVYEEDIDDDPKEEGPGEEDFDEDFLEALEAETAEAGQIEPPHPITLGEFYNERPEYDKITIDWYEEDDVYLDEREEIITDIQSYVGTEVKKLFDKTMSDEDPDVRFVRNEQYGSDYEIIRHHRSWRETNGGD